MSESGDVEGFLRELTAGEGLHSELTNLVHYCQFLLDDEDMLTKNSNLNAAGRALLHRRMAEVFGYESGDEGDEALEDDHAVTDREDDA